MRNLLGPWATAIDVGSHPQLSAFWKRRVSMLVSASRSALRISRPTALCLVAAAILGCALPTFRASPSAESGAAPAAAPAAAPSETAAPDGGAALDAFLERVERGHRLPGKDEWTRRSLHTRNAAGQIIALNLKEAKLEKGDFAVIGSLRHLEALHLTQANVTDEDLRPLKGLKNLRVLTLDWNRGISGAGLAHLGELDRLEHLDLRLTGIVDEDLRLLARFKNLRRLDVSDNAIGDEGLRHVAALSRLEVLNAGGTKITDAGLRCLKDLKNLRGLTLNETAVTEAGLKFLAEFPRLAWIASPKAAAEEFIRRLEGGDFAAAAEMYMPGVFMPTRGRMRLEKLEPLPPSDADRTLNRLRFHLRMHWVAEAEKIDEILEATFAVDHGAIGMHEVGIVEE